MASSKQEFERFVAWLHQTETQTPQNVRRLANLVLAHFEEVARTSRQHSQRSICLVALARRSLATTSDGLPNTQAVGTDNTWPWQRLRHLTLGPFRGFRRPEPFDLRKRINLFYGPNGSGKTSLCEGLEFALLGSVEEADTKRIEGRTYLANVHERRFEVPRLSATDHQNREAQVAANPETFRFCFIEKNRIDAFSRIAARPPAQRSELIATLFGVDKFSDFVSHFNESIDQQLVILATKNQLLANRRTALAVDQESVNSEGQVLRNLTDEAEAIAQTHSVGMTYEALKALIGTSETPGRLQELETIVNAVPPALIGSTRQGVTAAFDAIQQGLGELAVLKAELDTRSSQVSFKDLYTAVLALQPTEGDHCPACDTPLSGQLHVATNPYLKATAGLDQLKELTELQAGREKVEGMISTASREARQQLATLCSFLATDGQQQSPVCQYLTALPAEPTGEWWSSFYPARQDQADNTVTFAQLLAVADRAAAQDAASLLAREERQRNIAERDKLNELRLSVQAHDLKRRQAADALAASRRRITEFEAANASLIDEVAAEALNIQRDAPIKAAYDSFLELLRRYRNELPAALMAGLNESATDLYNSFNRNDLDADKLAALHLPLTSDQKIEISFRSQPQERIDALHVLSEGHIRCLGLAILLAKSQAMGNPLIIFDDAINAIDHDHRSGIRETIFESDLFANTQFIVTCHSNEFIKDIQQHLPAQWRNDSQVYLFRSHTGDHHPRVTGNVPSKNYITKARASVDALDHRDALTSSRQGLEMLSEKIWRWLGSHDLGVLSLQLAGVGADPGLRNLCEALLKRLNDAAAFTHTNKPALVSALGRVLGIPSANLVWTYLNKGTHEEANRDDFDASLVESVVLTLEEIDALDLRPGR
jgi:recombinational DNA repair ATPase RecF